MNVEILQCIQCERYFEFSKVEQERCASRGFDPPKRCPECRRHRQPMESEETASRRGQKKRRQHRKDDML